MAENTPRGAPKNERRQNKQSDRQSERQSDRKQETQADPQNDRRNGRPSNPQLPTGSVGMQDVLPRLAQMANGITKIAASYGGTGRFFASDGAVGTPSYTFISDTSSGMAQAVTGPYLQFGGNVLLSFAATGALAAPFSYTDTTASAADVNISATGVFRRSTSSAKYKRDIETMPYNSASFRALRPVTYRSRVDDDSGRIYGGLIAEEVHSAGYTPFVAYNAEGSPESVMYPHMVAVLIGALHDAQDKIAALETRVAALEAPNA